MALHLSDAWLASEPGPKMLVEALKLFGTHEGAGTADNLDILRWAKEIGMQGYTHDSVAWCGLFMAVVAKRAGKEIPASPLWALNWKNFGHPTPIAMLGDVLIFNRQGGGHVGLYVGEDDKAFHVLGGNQGDEVSIIRVLKNRLVTVRRPFYQVQPANVRVIKMSEDGKPISTNEA